MRTAVRNYALVTGAYWGFTLTDGALRMLVLLHFDRLGYSAVEIAFLFLFYEFFGIVTNLLGGWIAARSGLKVTLYGGLLLQIGALIMLALLNPEWSRIASVAYVMSAQALSGIAKDLTKMSAKTAIKVVVPEGEEGALFKWVARLTGSKNALKGAGFFLGGALLTTLGFRGSLTAMAIGLLVVLLGTVFALPSGMGKARSKVKFSTRCKLIKIHPNCSNHERRSSRFWGTSIMARRRYWTASSAPTWRRAKAAALRSTFGPIASSETAGRSPLSTRRATRRLRKCAPAAPT